MYFKESIASSRTLTNENGNKFYIRDHRLKVPKRKDATNDSRISSQSSIYGNNITMEDSIEKSLERIKPSKNELKEKPCYPNEHIQIQAEGKLKCTCTVCIAQNLLRTEPDDVVPDPFFINDSEDAVSFDRGFVYVLRRLLPPRHSSRSISIKVPETLVYLNGEARFIVMAGKDKTLKFVSQREKLAQHEIRKFFNDRFAQKDEEQRLVDTKNILESKNLILTSQDLNMTERTQGIELRRGTPSGLSTGKSSRQRTARSLKDKVCNQNREVALVKFNDDSTTILSEAEFENLVAKKKFDPYWKQIAFIQNYRGFSKSIHTLKKIYFIYDRERTNSLFYRASLEVQQIEGAVSPSSDNYIPPYLEDEFQQILKGQNEEEYCLYILMKIFHYVNIMHGVKIVKMCGEFVKDALDVLYLTNVSRLQYQAKAARDENYFKGMSMLNLETEEKSSLGGNDTLHDIQRKEDVETLTDLMLKQYENIKNSTGIKDVVPNYQEDISDNIYSQLYPNAPCKLSALLKSGPIYNQPRYLPSETSLQANGPIRGVYLGRSRNISILQNSHNTSGTGAQTSRSSVKSRMVKARGDSTASSSRTGRTLPSLGNVDGNSNANISASKATEPKSQGSKKENSRSNSQPNLRKALKFYGIAQSVNQYPKAPSEAIKDRQPRILKRTPSEILAQIPKAPKLNAGEGDCFTDRCAMIEEAQKNSNPNSPYVVGLKGLSRGSQDKLTSQLDQGSSTRRSQSVNKRALGYILNN